MEVYERIKKIRKDKKLSRRELGEILGVSESVIVNIELNRLKRPDQKEPIYKLICETFNINEQWLRTGEGEPYADSGDTEVVAALAARILRDEPESFRARCIEVFSKMDERQLSVLKDIALQLVADKEKDPLEQEVESYRQEVQLEIEAEEKSAPSAEQNDVSSA